MLKFRIQSTPNPGARKYILSEDVKLEGRVSYRDPNECLHVPLAYSLLNIAAVRQVHFFQNVITLTQDGSQPWTELDLIVQKLIRESIGDHDPSFIESLVETKKPATHTKEDSEALQKIDKILDQSIRPHLQMDGGDIELVSLEKNILSLRYLGACGGCPSSMTGTLAAIRSTLQERYQEDLEVLAL